MPLLVGHSDTHSLDTSTRQGAGRVEQAVFMKWPLQLGQRSERKM